MHWEDRVANADRADPVNVGGHDPEASRSAHLELALAVEDTSAVSSGIGGVSLSRGSLVEVHWGAESCRGNTERFSDNVYRLSMNLPLIVKDTS